MNLGTLLGFVFSMGVFILSVFLSLPDVRAFYDLNSIIIVVGGTAAATMICFPLKKIFVLLKVFMRRMFGKMKRDHKTIISDLAALSQAYNNGKRAFETAIKKVEDPFLRDAAEALFWLESDIRPEELRELLEQRAETQYDRYMDEANVFKTIAKFPPAFGLLGTTLGMIALLQSLGGEDMKANIGPAMAVALVTTLYGCAISNIVVIPIAENLTQQTKETDMIRRLIVEGIMMIEAKRPTTFVVEKVKSYLLPSERAS